MITVVSFVFTVFAWQIRDDLVCALPKRHTPPPLGVSGDPAFRD
jgi:hypothetical protein